MIDEYSLNPDIMKGRFWDMFILGVDDRMLNNRSGSLTPPILNRLFTFYDPHTML